MHRLQSMKRFMNACAVKDKIHHADQLILLFNRSLGESFNTLLTGGFAEPVYLPARGEQAAEIRFRDDYFSSALHEIAHWCIAGTARRRQEDYGYWYEADGRSPEQQQAFFQVEVKPQALEWCFSVAAGYPFQISTDNVAAATPDEQWQVWERINQQQEDFRTACHGQILRWFKQGFPGRGKRFIDVLQNHYQSIDSFRPELFRNNA